MKVAATFLFAIAFFVIFENAQAVITGKQFWDFECAKTAKDGALTEIELRYILISCYYNRDMKQDTAALAAERASKILHPQKEAQDKIGEDAIVKMGEEDEKFKEFLKGRTPPQQK